MLVVAAALTAELGWESSDISDYLSYLVYSLKFAKTLPSNLTEAFSNINYTQD